MSRARAHLTEAEKDKIVKLYTDTDCPITIRAIARRLGLASPHSVSKVLKDRGVKTDSDRKDWSNGCDL